MKEKTVKEGSSKGGINHLSMIIQQQSIILKYSFLFSYVEEWAKCLLSALTVTFQFAKCLLHLSAVIASNVCNNLHCCEKLDMTQWKYSNNLQLLDKVEQDRADWTSRSIICRSWRLRQIIVLRDTDRSQYFAITEFNNCFIIRSSSLFF